MLIHFRRSSPGFAFMPGLAKPKTLDTGTLPPAVARKIEALVQAAAFFGQATKAADRHTVRDATRYSITVADAGRQHTVEVSEPAASAAFKTLFNYLESVEAAR